MSPDMRRTKAALIGVGALAITLGLLGGWYNVGSMLRFPNLLRLLQVRALELPTGFVPVFWTMSTISLVLNMVVVGCGIQYVRLRSNVDRVFVIAAAFEVLYFAVMVLAGSWLPRIGASVASANGIANGGLVPQVIVLFPVWAPFVAIWAGRRLRMLDAAGAA